MDLLILLMVTGIVNPATSNIYTSVWRRVPALKLQTVLPLASASITHCGSMCSELERCISFCHDRWNKRCHVRFVGTSLVLLPSSNLLECYDWAPVECRYSDGYEMFGGRCIKFVPDKLDFFEARKRCAEDGSHLYHYKSLELDRQPFLDLLTHHGASTLEYFWVGADDLAQEGVFVWSDGTPLASDADLWWPGEPSDTRGAQNCVGTHHDGLLDDKKCGYLTPSVCQIGLPRN